MLDFKTVLDAATKAFNENRLGAQNGMGECMYQYPGTNYVCAVGAAYTASDDNDNTLAFHEIFTPEDVGGYDDFASICVLQALHDVWCTNPGQLTGLVLFPSHWPKDDDHWVYKWFNQYKDKPLGPDVFKSFLEWGARQ